MSYAIIRVEKHKKGNLKLAHKHDERKNTNYSNKNIDKSKSHLNYHLKESTLSYEREFERIRTENNLKGQIKEVSNIACEYLITSDKKFFDSIGEQETKKYFETAFDFACKYKNLGEENIISAVVHLDEDVPHMHLVFIPVVHTLDKQGNSIDKIACSEFWKGYDSFRDLQDSFYEAVINKGFELERGQTSSIKHLSVEDYKLITNYDKSVKALQDIEIKLPDVPDIKEITRLTTRRDELIQKEIIEPKDNLIKKLHTDNLKLYRELDRQVNIIDKADKYEKERTTILAQNKDLQSRCEVIENEYEDKVFKLNKSHDNRLIELENEFKEKSNKLNKDFETKTEEMEKQARKDTRKLEKENAHLTRIIDTLKDTVIEFIKWVSKKLALSPEATQREFEKENNIYLDPEKQIGKEEREQELDLEWD